MLFNENDCNGVKASDIANNFISNQEVMNLLSKARNARHIVVLQPHIDLLDSLSPEHNFKRNIYDDDSQFKGYFKHNVFRIKFKENNK